MDSLSPPPSLPSSLPAPSTEAYLPSPPPPPPPAVSSALAPMDVDVQVEQKPVLVAPLAPPPPPPKAVSSEPDKAANDWQTGFVWAFIAKFHPSLIGKGGISTVMDLEYALHAEGHSEVLSTILQCFILSFKQIKDLKDKNLPKHLLRTVDHCLGFTSMSVYHDRPISVSDPAIPLPTGEKDEAERKALNPLRRLFLETRAADEPSEGGHGGEDVVGKRVWMMDWREKLKLLRQLVDWQLAHSESIRAKIQEHYKMGHQKQTDFNPLTNELVVQPIGQDRNKKRYWTFDDSARIYTSTNPYKKQCPLTPVTSTKREILELIDHFRIPTPLDQIAAWDTLVSAGGPAGKKAKSAKALEEKNKNGELAMAQFLEQDHLPKIEREEERIARVRKKAEQAAIAIAQADIRTSRTRRTGRVDYANGGNGEGYEEEPDSDSSANSYASSSNRRSARGHHTRPVSAEPEWRGERRSTRVPLNNSKAAAQDPSTMIPFPPSPEPEPATTNIAEGSGRGAVETMEEIVVNGDSAASLTDGGGEIKEEGMREVPFGSEGGGAEGMARG